MKAQIKLLNIPEVTDKFFTFSLIIDKKEYTLKAMYGANPELLYTKITERVGPISNKKELMEYIINKMTKIERSY